MSDEKIKNIIEASIMVSPQALHINRIMSLFEEESVLKPERADIKTAIESLQKDYENRGVELVEVASGYRFQARNEYAEWVNKLFDDRAPRYSRALLETLAIIAYRQPITRGEIEDIRGVSVSGTIVKTLQEREWVKVVGHRDVPGKPELLATTKTFLDYFNLKKLSDLPDLADIKDFDSINPDLFEALNAEGENVDQTETVLSEDQNEISDNTDDASMIATDDGVSQQEEEITQDELEDDITDEMDEEESDAEEASAKVIPFSN